MSPADMSRVIQGLFAGIGSLGAGAILKQSDMDEVRVLTSAASLWATTAIARASGLGHESTTIISTLIALLILVGLLRFEPTDQGQK